MIVRKGRSANEKSRWRRAFDATVQRVKISGTSQLPTDADNYSHAG